MFNLKSAHQAAILSGLLIVLWGLITAAKLGWDSNQPVDHKR
ncbi:hypothetical protein [Paenibacillus cremeus]|nr:hypothetical protein [Paenibacillus cremeus]